MREIALYQIDTNKSLFTIHPFATGLAAALSHGLNISVRDFSGELKFVPGTLQDAGIRMKIKSDSLGVTDEMKESDRREIERAMKEQVLAVSQHPMIEFRSSSIKPHKTAENHYRLEVTGDLTLRGQVRSQTFEAIVVVGSDSLRAHGQFEIRQTSYGIEPVSALGGMIKVRDEIKLHFYIVAQKQSQG